MAPDVREFLSLKAQLHRERAQIQARLREIDLALEAPPRRENRSPSRGAGHGRGRRNVLSLKEAVLKATREHPLSKQEILREVEKLGYRFVTRDPMNSLGVILYGRNPRFKRLNGLFSPAD